MNTTKKQYGHYNVKYTPQDPCDINAFVLREIAALAVQAKHAIKEKNYESRFKLMDKAHVALISMREGIQETPENKVLAGAHRNFYNTMLSLVRDIDFENSTAACDALESCLKEMVETWTEVGRLYHAQEAGKIAHDAPAQVHQREQGADKEERIKNAESGLQLSV